MDFTIGNYWYLLLLLLLPLLALVLLNYLKWRKKKRNAFAEERFQENLFDSHPRFLKFFPVLYLLATLFLLFSIIDLLGANEEVKSSQKMNNVIFLLDVSNSMNAEDIQPNRLLMAKNIMISTMEKMKNDRVGIVVFAGEAASIMPLTTDYSAAETYISGIETSMMKIQGTDFLKAMQETARKFKNVAKGSRKVVLISDGEDNEGNEDKAISRAKSEGIRVISVGVGTEQGAPVPEYVFGQLMGYKTDRMGQTVLSQRQTNALEKMADATGGGYIDGNSLEEASVQIIDALNQNSSSSVTMVQSQNRIHYYQYFLAVSIFLFILIYLLNPKRDFNL
ncbi:MAG: VWA domain-containing protein [Weeksellaceae bacterium]|nr:VWA domain-containing protein [Weeksellaceae bacterium]